MAERFLVRPFEKITNDLRWTGRIEDGVYVWSVGARTYRLRTLGVEADERGEFAWLKPYEKPLDSGLWLRVEAKREELFGEVHVYCRLSVLRVCAATIRSAARVAEVVDAAQRERNLR